MITKTEARKIALKMTEDYEPTEEEFQALVEYGFMTEAEAAMLSNQNEIGTEPEEANEMQYEETLVVDNTEDVETEEIEDTQEIQEVEETKEVGVVVARSQDGKVTDIRGRVVGFGIQDITKDDEAKTPDIAIVDVVVRDLDGEDININIPTKTKLNYLLYRIDTKEYINGMSKFNRLDVAEKQAELQRLVNMERELWFRTVEKDGGLDLFATVTPKYQKKVITDILPIIVEELGDVDIKVTESDGMHGGLVRMQTAKDDVMKFTTEINMGPLDGLHAIQITAHGQVLYCQNQLTMEVQNIFRGKLPKLNFGARQVHAGSAEELRETLGKVLEDIKAYRSIIEDGKGIEITPEIMAEVLDFYKYKGMMSAKVKNMVASKLLDDEVQQVPGTVWGLAMAVTWVGTHENDDKGKPLNDGVRHAMSKIGAEILVASQFWEEYMQMVMAFNGPAREEEAIKEAEKQAKKEAKQSVKESKKAVVDAEFVEV